MGNCRARRTNKPIKHCPIERLKKHWTRGGAESRCACNAGGALGSRVSSIDAGRPGKAAAAWRRCPTLCRTAVGTEQSTKEKCGTHDAVQLLLLRVLRGRAPHPVCGAQQGLLGLRGATLAGWLAGVSAASGSRSAWHVRLEHAAALA